MRQLLASLAPLTTAWRSARHWELRATACSLAWLLHRQGRHYDEAIALTRGAVEFEPAGQDLSLAYFLLADLYNRTGRADLSASFAERGRQAEAERRN
jgi:hypothetical protein